MSRRYYDATNVFLYITNVARLMRMDEFET